MKRDMDLVRRILIEIEEKDNEIQIEGYSPEQINYHIRLLLEAELIRATDVSSFDGEEYLIDGLTWQGHEFLDQARSETVWNKAKKFLSEKGVDLSLHALKTALAIVTKELMSP